MKFKKVLSDVLAGILAISSSFAAVSPTAFAADDITWDLPMLAAEASAQIVIDSQRVNGWDSFDVDLRLYGSMNEFTTVTITCVTEETGIVGDDEKAPEAAFGVVINDNWDLDTMPRCGYNPNETVFEMTRTAEELENNPVFTIQSQLPVRALFTVTVSNLTADNRAAISLAPLSENVTLYTSYDASDRMDGGNCYGSVSIPAKNISGDYAITYGETTVSELRENVKYISTSANPYYGDSLDEGAGAFNYNVAIVCGNGVVVSTMSSEDSFDLTSPGTTYIDDLCTNELDSFVVYEIKIEISAKLFWNDEISKNQAVSDKIRLAKPNTPIQLEIVEDLRITLPLPAIDKYSMVLTAEEGQDWLIGSYAYADYIVPDPVGKTYGNTTIGALRSVLKRFNTTANTYVSDSLNAGEDSFEYCIDMEANNGEDYVRFANDSFRLTESGFVYVDNFDYNGTKISSGTYDDYVITAFIIKVQSALGWDGEKNKRYALCEDIKNMTPGDTLTLNLKEDTREDVKTEVTDTSVNMGVRTDSWLDGVNATGCTSILTIPGITYGTTRFEDIKETIRSLNVTVPYFSDTIGADKDAFVYKFVIEFADGNTWWGGDYADLGTSLTQLIDDIDVSEFADTTIARVFISIEAELEDTGEGKQRAVSEVIRAQKEDTSFTIDLVQKNTKPQNVKATVSGTGKASGTFGDKLSELTVSGLTAKLGDTEIEGTWALSGNTIPNVGDTTKYTATFTPSENADWYNELTAEVSLDIAKADAPEIEDIKLTYNWAATGEKTATVSGLPDNMGIIGAAIVEIADENGIIENNSVDYDNGKLSFTLNGFDSEKKDISATIKVALPTQNYKDITFNVIVSITAKLDKDAPAESEFELNVDLLSDNTYTATITTALTGVEYSFDGVNWSSTNTKAVGHAETLTGYIRYAQTDEYNASPYSSKTAATGHGTLTHHAAKAATCTEDGNIEYWTCDSCKLYFSDANGTTEITQAQTVLTKLGHEWAEKYNFDKDGHWHQCEVCGDTSEIEPHVSDSAATADSAEICTVCGYEIAPKLGQVAAPMFAPNGGTFTEVQTVTITSATEGAEIYYTTDGTEPTTSSTKYTAAITIGKTTTVKAIAVKDGMTDSSVITAEYTINLPVKETVATPVISPNGGSFSGSQTVTIICATEGAKIYYTTDGSAPTTSSKLYESAFTISVTTTVKAIAVKDGMVDSEVVSATFTKKSSGGSSGGGSSRPTTPTTTNPSIGGSAKSWSDVAADLGKLTNGSEATIELNGSTSVSVDVIKAIADKDINVKLVIDSTFAWVVDGAEITAPAAADLTFIKTAGTKSSGLRGTEGTQFKINDTGVPTSLEIAFKKAHAGKFANLYKNVSGKLVFVTCAKLGEDGKVILPDVVEKGDYVAMLCEFSDRHGDMDNDGIMNAKDASAILKDIVEIEPGKNPLMADFNGDGRINAMDAAAILKRIVGLA